ncbi:hypothetical protein [Paenibacillus durus]|uniref:hypothetical protein n=1 Tax=Paenibacillus durus TaxID=44251 RepID=UPI000472C27A|nr:hypothetical protein [Paenibacillus durus]
MGPKHVARVKGKTEKRLLRLPFKPSYMYRPGYIHPTKRLAEYPSLLLYFNLAVPGAACSFPRSCHNGKETRAGDDPISRSRHGQFHPAQPGHYGYGQDYTVG